MTIEIRTIRHEELRQLLEAVENANGEEISEEAWPYIEQTIEPDRALGAYEGAHIVGGAAAYTFRLTVPGGSAVGAAGVTWVGVLPTHRRRGALRAMMAHQLRDARDRGEQVAILWASEGSIYQRFGYGLASLNGRIEVARDRAVFSSPAEPSGEARMIDRSEALALFPPVYDALRTRTPGFFSRSPAWWQGDVLPDVQAYRRGAGRKFYVVHERDGEAAGYVMYRVAGDWGDVGSQSVLIVQELLGVDAAAERDLWQYVFGHDLIHQVRARVGPSDHPLLLMVTEPRRLTLRVGDGLWLRILDVAAALRARSYAADDSLVLEVDDTFVPAFAGRWRLTTMGGVAQVEPSSDPADLALDVTDLGALYLGAFSFAQLARAGRTTELVPGAHARADAMFITLVAPWCPQIF